MTNQLQSLNNVESVINIVRIFPANSSSENQIFLQGKFNVSYDKDGLIARGSEVLKHIVLVVTRDSNYQAVTPFKNVIVFHDDVVETETGCSGFFSITIFNHIEFHGSGDFYILCSIGSLRSNILYVAM